MLWTRVTPPATRSDRPDGRPVADRVRTRSCAGRRARHSAGRPRQGLHGQGGRGVRGQAGPTTTRSRPAASDRRSDARRPRLTVPIDCDSHRCRARTTLPVLQRLSVSRQPRGPRRGHPSRRLHYEFANGRYGDGIGVRARAAPAGRSLDARGLSQPIRHLPQRCRSAGCPPPASVHRGMGRPRISQRCVVRWCARARSIERCVDHTAVSCVPGVSRVDARSRIEGHRHPSLPLVPVWRPG